MFNNRLSIQDARERMQQCMEEAETYRLHKRLGYSDSKAARWIFILIVLMIVGAAVILY